jgi:hypothetical protein
MTMDNASAYRRVLEESVDSALSFSWERGLCARA